MSRPRRPAFTVRATAEQAERWRAAAEFEGSRDVGAWLATLASERLRYLGSMVPRMVLTWRRARFQALHETYGEPKARLQEVAGIVGGPFGIYKRSKLFHLAHVPTGCSLTTQLTQRRCKQLARELAKFKINWNTSDPHAVTGPDFPRLRMTLTQYRRDAFPEPPRSVWPPPSRVNS